MSYKNSVKLFASNFTLVWKQLLYLLICGIIFGVCAYTLGKPIIDLLRANGVFHEIKVLVETVYNDPSEIALNLSELFKHIFNVIFVENFSSVWLILVGLAVFCIIVPYLLLQISCYNINSILYKKLSMNMNVGYLQNGIRNLGKGLIFGLSNILFGLPFVALDILFITIYLTVATSILSAIIGLIVVSLLMIVVNSIKLTLFTCYTGYMVENECSPFVAFGKGFKMTFTKFWKILSTSIAVTLTLILVNGFIALFTFFAGTLISVPATFVFLSIFYLVVYFNTKGERYYLGPNLIINPSQYTIKQDEVTIIEIPEKPKHKQPKNSNKNSIKKTKSNENEIKENKENKE